VILDELRGYASVFNSLSGPINEAGSTFLERIERGAFCVAGAAIQATVQHGPQVFASTTDGTLRVWQDRIGLAFRADIIADVHGAGLRDWIADGSAGCSIGLIALCHEWEHGGALPTRIVSKAAVDHISVCGDPAYPATAVWLASAPRASMTARVRMLARHWEQNGSPSASARHATPTNGKTKRGGEPYIIPESLMKMVARHVGRC
jgi:HK97 family phage prohead protease